MSKELVVSSTVHETRVATLENDQLVEISIERASEHALAGNIYKGRVSRVLPGMQSAFVKVGLERDAFLYVSDVIDQTEDIEEGDQDDAEDSVVTEEASASSSRQADDDSRDDPGGSRRRGGRGRRGRRRGRGRGRDDDDSDRRESRESNQDSGRTGRPARGERPDPADRSDEAEPEEGQRKHVDRRRSEEAGDRDNPRRRRRGRGGRRVRQDSEDDSRDTREDASPGLQLLPGESLAKYRDTAEEAEKDGYDDYEDDIEEEVDESDEERLDEDEDEELDEEDSGSEGEEEEDEEYEYEYVYEEEEVEDDDESSEDGEDEPESDSDGGEEDEDDGSAEDADSRDPDDDGDEEPAGDGQGGDADDEDSDADSEEEADDDESNDDDSDDESDDEGSDDEDSDEDESDDEPGDDDDDAKRAARVDDDSKRAEVRDRSEGPSLRRGGRGRRRGGRGRRGRSDEPAAAETGVARSSHSEPGQPEDRRRGRDSRRPSSRRDDRSDSSSRPEEAATLISDLLKPGQEVIVQVAKEPLGKKGARITSHIALPGRFLVYMPTVKHVGVSRKIHSDAERGRLRRVIRENLEGAPGGCIVRTAGQGASDEDIIADLKFLINIWRAVQEKAEKRPAPTLLHQDLDVVERILRDQLGQNFKTIWVDSEEEYERILGFVERFQPDLVSRIKLYSKRKPIFDELGISKELEKALRPKVWLKSGGYLVINQTEALVAIDINTGKYVGKSDSLEDTIVQTNLDAVKEIVRQMRLRDLGGIIVVDFIDMDDRQNRKRVLQELELELRTDRAPSKVLSFNEFGLVAITRKRVKQSLERTLCAPCPSCTGSGFVKSVTTMILEILEESRKVAAKRKTKKDVTLRVHPDVARALKSRDNAYLQELEETFESNVIVRGDLSLHRENYDVVA